MPQLPSLATFPRDDAAFAGYVRDSMNDLAAAGPLDHETLQRRLRTWHSRAVVHVREELGGLMPERVWYVYRDGGIARSDFGWWTNPGVAALTFDRSGMFRSANQAAADLVNRPIEDLVGAVWSDLVPPDAAATDPAWLWRLLDAGHAVQSLFELPIPDGSRRVIEFRSQATDDPDIFASNWRAVSTIWPGEFVLEPRPAT